MNLSALPTADELARLPHRAQVAFATCCGRRVQPLLPVVWPDAPPECCRALERALALAEGFAASGRLAAHTEHVEAAAQAALGISAGKAVPEAARRVAGACLNALSAARASTPVMARVALSAATEAGKVAALAALLCGVDVEDALRADFEALRAAWEAGTPPAADGGLGEGRP